MVGDGVFHIHPGASCQCIEADMLGKRFEAGCLRGMIEVWDASQPRPPFFGEIRHLLGKLSLLIDNLL